jgi:hypothetical protein
MTNGGEEREFTKAMADALKPLIAKAKREAWCAGRDAAADACDLKLGTPYFCGQHIRALEPPEDL